MSLLPNLVKRSRSAADVVDRRFLLTSTDRSAAKMVLTCVENDGGFGPCESCDTVCSVTTYSVTNRVVPTWLKCEVHYHNCGTGFVGGRSGHPELVIYPTYRLLGMLAAVNRPIQLPKTIAISN